MIDQNQDNQSYRDRIATVNKQGERLWVYPKKPSGFFYKWRSLLSWVFLGFLFAGPHLRVGGEPLLLLNIIERKFIVLGKIFWPQDIHLFALLMLVGVVFILVFTLIFGRIFCGWICPQTIFMEMLFRKLEYLIEGDWKQQQRLNKLPWNAEKIQKKLLKYASFWVVSFLIANTFLAYIIGSEQLFAIISEPPSQHWGGLMAILVFTGVFYWVFAWFREQVCTLVCPYGRLQSVLLDKNSIVVAYDYKRGERRGKYKKAEDRAASSKGDCIDCGQCVNVCPTGIDIRNGTQLECVNCTACIDACDYMMENVGLQKGLIRYASEEMIEKNEGFRWTTKMVASSAVLVVLLGLMGFMLTGRKVVETTVLRARGSLYYKIDENHYSNMYTYKIVNKGEKDFHLNFVLENTQGDIEVIGSQDLTLVYGESLKGTLMVKLSKDQIIGRKTPLEIGIYDGAKLLEKINTHFLSPN